METADIHFRVEGKLGHITLDRPRALNALTLPMCEAMLQHLTAWAAEEAVGCVLIDAVPGRAFCAGGDIRAVTEWGKAGDPRALAFFRTEYIMNAAIKAFPKPYVALIDGICMGGGAGISVHGTHRVVSETALFAMPETGIGFFPDIGASHFLPRCPGEIGTYLGLTGARIGAADLMLTGLATHAVPSARLADIAPRLAAGEAVDAVLNALAEAPGEAPLAARRAEIDNAFSAAAVEHVLRRLAALGDWGEETARELQMRSPTSLKVSLAELRRGRGRSLAECLQMEFQIAAQMLQSHDFYEGVRAAVVDKDHTPHWQPAHLGEVSQAAVAAYFTLRVQPLTL
jgi:enoyl-CoA hydratase